MWTGNVPADANEDELRALFGTDAGVTSLHLIARSNCAFVNFDTQDALLAAVARFDGMPARAGDPRCPRLVCRVRRKEDDLRAGVGAQRGTGVHRTWVKDSNAPGQQQTPSPESSTQGNGQGKPRHQSSGSDSYASTDSDLLGQHFPRRFFILKSLSQVILLHALCLIDADPCRSTTLTCPWRLGFGPPSRTTKMYWTVRSARPRTSSSSSASTRPASSSAMLGTAAHVLVLATC
jgi:hypothetical protein